MALFSTLIALFSLMASFPIEVSGPMLYLLHRGEAEKAFDSYLDYVQESQSHDFSLLQQGAKALLEHGIASKDEEIRLLSLFGAGVATASDLLPILSKGVKSNDLKMQLVALSYLSKQLDDESDLILLEALSSPFLLPRLEALFQLAKKNHPAVMGHLHSLIVKVPEQVRALFSQIAIQVEGTESTRYLKNLLSDASLEVRTQTILTLAEGGRDDFLPQIRFLSLGSSYAQLESCAWAFGKLKDYLSLNRLKELAEHPEQSVKLSAALALFELGERSYLDEIKSAAQTGSLFAIYALGQIKEGQDLLIKMLSHSDREIRLNAVLSLLKLRAPPALQSVSEFLIEEGRDYGYWRITSAGGLTAWKIIPSASCQTKNYPGLFSQTLSLKEDILCHCVEFEEADFLKVAGQLFEKRQHNLTPLLIEVLLNLKSEKVTAFLKDSYQKAGAPLIRNYSLLALYRLNEPGPYQEQLIRWVKEQGMKEMIRFKKDEEDGLFSSPHALTPEETSHFLVEACQALASSQNEVGIETLIHVIAHGNPKNRYALAGLLIRTAE